MIALPLSSRIGTAASRRAVIGLEQGMSAMGGAAPSTMGSLALPALAFVFTLLLVGYGVWDLDQLSGPGPSGHYSLAVTRVAPPAATSRGVGPVGGHQLPDRDGHHHGLHAGDHDLGRGPRPPGVMYDKS